ncbi:hypothetical protein [Bacteroides sp. BFG-606]|uniref:hypothetical protein n=1 Tax=Bacteroides sp. BFG-606 TaxID=2972763 RepID=UPI0021669717|nr:hypothetical protein [Bacteroides sp. BFG-606]MCS2333634.1 hypothetical protein [Bacteroides sp. BFG-606]
MENHNKMKLWEDLSQEEKDSYYYNENNTLSRLAPLLKANPVFSEINMDEHFKRIVTLATDETLYKKIQEGKAKKWYYSSWNKTEVEVFYDAYFDNLLLSIDHTQELACLSAEGEIRANGDKQEYIKYLEGELKNRQALTIRRYKQLGIEWYQKGMPDIDRKSVLFGLFDIDNLEQFRCFVSDLMFIKRVKDLIEKVRCPLIEEGVIQTYCEDNKKRDKAKEEKIENDIVTWFYKCFASYIEKPHITYLEEILLCFLKTGVVPENISEIHMDERIKRGDIYSFMWYVWHLWNNRSNRITREQCALFLLKVFPKLCCYWNKGGNRYTPLEITTIKKHLKADEGKFIKLPKQFK